MKNCERKNLISPLIDGEVSPENRESIETHLGACAECEREFADFKEMSAEFEPLRNLRLNSDVRRRLHASIGRDGTPVMRIFRFATAIAAAVTLSCGALTYYYTTLNQQAETTSDLMEIAAYAHSEAYALGSDSEADYIALMISEHQGGQANE